MQGTIKEMPPKSRLAANIHFSASTGDSRVLGRRHMAALSRSFKKSPPSAMSRRSDQGALALPCAKMGRELQAAVGPGAGGSALQLLLFLWAEERCRFGSVGCFANVEGLCQMWGKNQ